MTYSCGHVRELNGNGLFYNGELDGQSPELAAGLGSRGNLIDRAEHVTLFLARTLYVRVDCRL